ncbi:hypothetical protein FQN54_004840 [Arachnomyces sp. PD_36]|nr:hypothetical protein FQN54_004840 [Arachnomyces sp. PD_36]
MGGGETTQASRNRKVKACSKSIASSDQQSWTIIDHPNSKDGITPFSTESSYSYAPKPTNLPLTNPPNAPTDPKSAGTNSDESSQNCQPTDLGQNMQHIGTWADEGSQSEPNYPADIVTSDHGDSEPYSMGRYLGQTPREEPWSPATFHQK